MSFYKTSMIGAIIYTESDLICVYSDRKCSIITKKVAKNSFIFLFVFVSCPKSLKFPTNLTKLCIVIKIIILIIILKLFSRFNFYFFFYFFYYWPRPSL